MSSTTATNVRDGSEGTHTQTQPLSQEVGFANSTRSNLKDKHNEGIWSDERQMLRKFWKCFFCLFCSVDGELAESLGYSKIDAIIGRWEAECRRWNIPFALALTHTIALQEMVFVLLNRHICHLCCSLPLPQHQMAPQCLSRSPSYAINEQCAANTQNEASHCHGKWFAFHRFARSIRWRLLSGWVFAALSHRKPATCYQIGTARSATRWNFPSSLMLNWRPRWQRQ